MAALLGRIELDKVRVGLPLLPYNIAGEASAHPNQNITADLNSVAAFKSHTFKLNEQALLVQQAMVIWTPSTPIVQNETVD